MSAIHTLEQLRAGELTGITRLKLTCGLSEVPPEVFNLADTLEILDLSGNKLSRLPDDLPRLTKLRIIFCSDNQFTELPAVLGACRQLSMIGFKANRIAHIPPAALPPALRWLTLTDNRITALPAEIGSCDQLQKLMLAGNRLTELPLALASCTRLELLRISANRLTALPGWLLSMPRLAWLAYAGNPFCEQHDLAALAAARIGTIAWSSLQLEHRLGEGASGVIYQAKRRDGSEVQPVAIKLFKGEVTSDGLPDSEMTACMTAGRHANLIAILGQIDGHPAAVRGLVMPLIDPAFGNLAGPPSLDSCTRDVYPAGATFTLPSLLAIACGVASAAGHLHRQGMMHGDLYAHNILHRASGESLLGDFGAACLFDPATPQATALQRLEVRAFGCLLEELVARLAGASQTVRQQLAALTAACLRQDVAARPLFGEIEERLSELVQFSA